MREVVRIAHASGSKSRDRLSEVVRLAGCFSWVCRSGCEAAERPGADGLGRGGRAEFHACARLQRRGTDGGARAREHAQALSDSGGGGESLATPAQPRWNREA